VKHLGGGNLLNLASQGMFHVKQLNVSVRRGRYSLGFL
jgi:hypothetical protein